ncbi:MAG TPA: S41 family peptidase [Patescibacteria group bacterium]
MVKISLPTARKIVISLFLFLVTFALGYKIGYSGLRIEPLTGSSTPKVTVSRTVPVRNLDFSLFWQVWDTINSSYYDKSKVQPANLVYGAIKGMVSAVGDPYTLFLPPSDNKISQEDLQGNFSGVGIQIGYKGTNLAVMSPLPGTPAEKAGLKGGDLIVAIKDDNKKINKSTTDMTLPEAVEAIRGEAGTKITLAILRTGTDKPFTVDLVREKINVPSVSVSYVGDNESIAQIKLFKFGGETTTEWQKAVSQINSKNVKGIILDLRNNPGGYLQAAVDLAGEFLPRGSVAVIEDKGGNDKTPYNTTKDTGAFLNAKVVVLVNGGSASASEILAGALRDDRKISLIGEKTFGKGTIQEPQDLPGGSGLHITIAKWLTPNGTWVNEKGLDPDIEVKEDPNSKDDVQLQKAIEVLKSQF